MKGIIYKRIKTSSTLLDDDLILNQQVERDVYFLGVKVFTYDYIVENYFTTEEEIQSPKKSKKVGFNL